MGNVDSHQRLGERVLAAKTKLQHNTEITLQRYEYLKTRSPEVLDVMLKSVADSFESFSPFLEPILLIAWMHDSKRCKKIVLDACSKVLTAPIHQTQYQWFQQYVFPSSLWLFQTEDSSFMYQELLSIAKNMSHDIIDSMDSIYEHLEGHKKWSEMKRIANQSRILRQDHEKVGLLQENAFTKDVFESKTGGTSHTAEEEEKTHELKAFIDSNLAINILTSTARNINDEFQTHVRTVMNRYGKVKAGPPKKVERCVSKLENDYQDASYPKAAKLLDLVRCSVTFNTVEQLITGYRGLMRHIGNSEGIIELSRVKNGFLVPKQEGGYRDIKVNVIYKSQIDPGLNMICEIQLLLINYLEEKKRIHKLYSIVREEIYFQMVVQKEKETGAEEGGIGPANKEFVEVLNVGKEVKLKYAADFNKCSADPQLGLLCMEGINWFGVVDIKEKKAVLEQKRDSPSYPWYGRQSHRWLSVDDEKYLSVQTKKNEIKMYRISAKKKFKEHKKFGITLSADTTINYVDFDKKFESILLVINDQILQKRSMKDVNNITDRITLDENITQSSFRNLKLSNDGNLCGLGGGGGRNYFYLIDIGKKKQYKMKSAVLSDTYAPCFINGENNFISVSDKKGRIEIWDINKRQSIHTMSIGAMEWVTSAASTNNILAIASWDKKLRLYDVRHNYECFYEKEYKTKPTSLHLTADSQYLTIGGTTGGDRCCVLQIQ